MTVRLAPRVWDSRGWYGEVVAWAAKKLTTEATENHRGHGEFGSSGSA